MNDASDSLERLREEKDEEIMILQEGMDSTIKQLSEAQQVHILLHAWLAFTKNILRI